MMLSSWEGNGLTKWRLCTDCLHSGINSDPMLIYPFS